MSYLEDTVPTPTNHLNLSLPSLRVLHTNSIRQYGVEVSGAGPLGPAWLRPTLPDDALRLLTTNH